VFADTPTGTFATIDPPGAPETYALGINDAGQIVGQFTDGWAPLIRGVQASKWKSQSTYFILHSIP
jgi:hypothetical protein